ncbi:bifunctional metallophosphatase/5'-nucleotidase [Microvirga alba]|uniref:Bifunctional metallophosphatase/5'-nucleotidase n=1 Tax=Microvirga alba TaxID=2791025 RepID=A0A931BS76_9HYPH|nr:bifunctional UDP-sugar hydrolase/5'-nucleotidase [Microvirga alba]MBF9234744.1 bifunctional metallophosphatase/5'-nucleotidase [Microvirga alba]
MVQISRRQSLGLGLGAGLSATMLGGRNEAQAAAPKVTFTLLLVNDIYKMSDTKGRGGFAKLAAIVKAERARGVPVLFCHAGDTFSPSLMSGFDQGAHIIELTNMVKPDVFVPGNHEFDFGKDIYLKRMGEANFPFFGANIRQADGSPVPKMKDSAIFDLGPVKVGVVGLALAETARISSPGDLKFLPELDVLKSQAADLRKQGADMIVAVAHTDRDVDNAIVRSRLADVLLTGHDHDLAITYDGKTVMVESGEDAEYVTAVDIIATVAGEGSNRKVTWSPSFRVNDTSAFDPDPEVLAVVSRYEAALSKELDVEIGTSTNALDTRSSTVRSQEAAFGNLVADAIKDSTAGDIAITNGGGIRANKEYPAGVKLTRRDILSEMPFGNTTSLVEVTGADVKAALENGVSQIDIRGGRFPQVSGLKFEVDSKAPVGSRVSNIQANGQPLDLAKRYKVATNNFMLTGGDGYVSFTKGKVLVGLTDGKLMANEVMSYVRKLGTVDAKVEGRIVIR